MLIVELNQDTPNDPVAFMIPEWRMSRCVTRTERNST